MQIRLHIEDGLSSGDVISLSGPQSHYLRGVMRRGVGDALLVFNGRDGEFSAAIETLGKKNCTVRIGAQRRAPVTEPDIWLLFAPVKRGPVDMIAQKATELGVSVLAPVETAHTVAGRVNVQRLSAIAVEAAEQCERLSAPKVRSLEKLDVVLDAWPSDRALIYCDEAGDDPEARWGGDKGRAPPMLQVLCEASMRAKAAILIGPEGGFSPQERARIRAHPAAQAVTLGPRILRADTAAITALSLWQAVRGDFSAVLEQPS